jgi:hypothetical protein
LLCADVCLQEHKATLGCDLGIQRRVSFCRGTLV